MTLAQRRRIIRELCASTKAHLLREAKGMPEHWDGIEIRQYAVDLALDNALPMTRTYVRRYRRDVALMPRCD